MFTFKTASIQKQNLVKHLFRPTYKYNSFRSKENLGEHLFTYQIVSIQKQNLVKHLFT
jgi:hypothetical protein